MKRIKHIYIVFAIFLAFSITAFYSCERGFSDEVEFASFAVFVAHDNCLITVENCQEIENRRQRCAHGDAVNRWSEFT